MCILVRFERFFKVLLGLIVLSLLASSVWAEQRSYKKTMALEVSEAFTEAQAGIQNERREGPSTPPLPVKLEYKFQEGDVLEYQTQMFGTNNATRIRR